MGWFILFLLGIAIVCTGLVKALRTRQPDMLMLIGGVVAFIGLIGSEHWPVGAVLGSMPRANITSTVFRIGGWCIALWAAYQLIWSMRVLTWPGTEATITQSEAVFTGTRGADLNGKRNTTRYEWRVSYTYTVNGRSYTSSVHSLDTDERDLDMGAANRLAERHPKGSTITVHYHPRDPQLACIDRTWLNGRWLVPAIFAAMMLWAGYAP